jgi:hypothetical protein
MHLERTSLWMAFTAMQPPKEQPAMKVGPFWNPGSPQLGKDLQTAGHAHALHLRDHVPARQRAGPLQGSGSWSFPAEKAGHNPLVRHRSNSAALGFSTPHSKHYVYCTIRDSIPSPDKAKPEHRPHSDMPWRDHIAKNWAGRLSLHSIQKRPSPYP